MIIAREKEQRILQDAFSSKQSEFIAIYGRRRIGKTFLVRETLGKHFAFSHTGVANANVEIQLEAFRDSLKTYGIKLKESPKSWIEAFSLLKTLIENSEKSMKKVIFLDELSWMDTAKSNFLTALEFFWNGWASARKDVLLVVCASSTSWIIDNLIHNKGGLHNRLTGRIHLNPFYLKDCAELAKENGLIAEHMDIIKYYMVLGGIPFYWNLLKKGYSVAQNIDALFFASDAPLHDEYEYLYSSLFKKPEVYMEIVKTLAKKNSGMSRLELIEKAHLSNSGNITKKLEELEQCGFIRKYYEFGKQKKDAVFQLIDSFTLFYFRFMEKRTMDSQFWMHSTGTHKITAWQGLAFERICLLHIDQIKKKLEIGGVLTEVQSWYCKADKEKGLLGSQIDLLICRRDQVINICEMKYYDGLYTMNKADYLSVQNKINDFKLATGTRYALHPTLITSFGAKKNSYSENMQDLICAEDLFC